MSGQNPNQTKNGMQMDRDKCMEMATGGRWLSLEDGLDSIAVRAVLDACYRMLRAEAERT